MYLHYERCFTCDEGEGFAFRCCHCDGCDKPQRYVVCRACAADTQCRLCGAVGGYLTGDDDYDVDSQDSTHGGFSYRDEVDSQDSTSEALSCRDDSDAASLFSDPDLDLDDDFDTDAKCYMPDTEFELADGNWIKVQDLQPGMIVFSHGAQPIKVHAVSSHNTIDTAGMLLTGHGHCFQIPLSVDHRVVIPRGQYNHPQSIPASHLRKGDKVCCKSGIVTLLDAEPLILDDGLPDFPVPVFWVGHDCLLTKGTKRQGRQRGLQRLSLKVRLIQYSDNWPEELNQAYWQLAGRVDIATLNAQLHLVDRYANDLGVLVRDDIAQVSTCVPYREHFPLILRW
ncbi:unnamed protein product [Symbiodinium sp. CCMP2456]|nr:unnamed protein product [Symbiodinium sp. CCMP2456]